MVPPYGIVVYDNTNPMWIPNAVQNPQSNCLKEPRKQKRIDILEWTQEIKEVSKILNLDTEEMSLMGIKLYYAISKKKSVNRHHSQKQQLFGNHKHTVNYLNL